MFILVLVVLMTDPTGMPYKVQTEYQFYSRKHCELMEKTIEQISKQPFKTSCEQVT